MIVHLSYLMCQSSHILVSDAANCIAGWLQSINNMWCGCEEVGVGVGRRWVWGGGCGEVVVVVGRWVWVWGGGCKKVGVSVSVGVWEVGAGRWVWGVGVGRWVWVWAQRIQSCSCTKMYILRARLYHFIFVCPISYFQSESVWSAKQIGGCGEVCVWVGGCG